MVVLRSEKNMAILAPTRKSTATNTVRPSTPDSVSLPRRLDYLFYAMNDMKYAERKKKLKNPSESQNVSSNWIE